jgi:hypothetical protein
METAMTLRIDIADPAMKGWCNRQIVAHHYLHQHVHVLCRPLHYVVWLGDDPVGTLIVSSLEATRCYDPSSRLTYGSVDDVARGRAMCTRHQLINLARVWLHPRVQRDGADYVHHAASTVVRALHARVHYDWLVHRPPVDVTEPYHLRSLVSYCDTRLHTGWLYLASRFRLARTNAQGVQTYVRALPPLTPAQDAHVRAMSLTDARARRIRASRAVRQEVLL